MSISLTRILQQITGLNTFFAGPSASRDNGVVLLDTATVTWGTDGQGNIQATASGSSLPSGAANLVVATPNGSSGTAALRALVPADLPVGSSSQLGALQVDGTTITAAAGVISSVTPANIAFTNVANTFTSNQTIASGSLLEFPGSQHQMSFGQGGTTNEVAMVVTDVTNTQSVAAFWGYQNGGTIGVSVPTVGGFLWSGTNQAYGVMDSGITRLGGAELAIGNGAQGDASGALSLAFLNEGVGAQLTAAATITPTTSIHHVTGATVIETITVPAKAAAGWTLTLIPDSAGTTGLTGNISLASTLVQNRALTMTWDGTKFYPSY